MGRRCPGDPSQQGSATQGLCGKRAGGRLVPKAGPPPSAMHEYWSDRGVRQGQEESSVSKPHREALCATPSTWSAVWSEPFSPSPRACSIYCPRGSVSAATCCICPGPGTAQGPQLPAAPALAVPPPCSPAAQLVSLKPGQPRPSPALLPRAFPRGLLAPCVPSSPLTEEP